MAARRYVSVRRRFCSKCPTQKSGTPQHPNQVAGLSCSAIACWTLPLMSGVATGLGNGARVAAVVAGRCRGHVAGCCLLSYPLLVGQPAACASACLHIFRGHHTGHAGSGARSSHGLRCNISSVNSTDEAKVLRLAGGPTAHKVEQSCQAGPGPSRQATRLCEPQNLFPSCSHFPPKSTGRAIYSGLL